MRDNEAVIGIDEYLRQRERPAGPAAMFQEWRDLVFLHATADPQAVQALMPRGLTVDTFPDGTGNERAWLGLVTFKMQNIRWRNAPPIPTATNFLEYNVRTYVHREGRDPGVWFFSLDASSRLAVAGARISYSLPYFHAEMLHTSGQEVRYESSRGRRGLPGVKLRAKLSATTPTPTEPGTLGFFLAERYRLYASRRGALLTGLVAHAPYEVSELADWTVEDTLVEAGTGLSVPLSHGLYSPGVRVEVFPVQKVR
ncbi:MAG: DUF2071 domain-containing protein [Armatimonadetes bacterium]|nr:DUF2071 domain-containing protein [Armatimonadota bacterium]